MELASAPESARDPAPALQRGLALLRLLDRDGPQSLERLARVTGWPKSSVHRLLQSLEMNRAVRRDPQTRRYTAMLRLVEDAPSTQALRHRAQPVMARLAEQTGHTLELHIWQDAADQLLMDLRTEPDDTQVAVRAKIGSHRELLELDATAQVVMAFVLPKSRWPRRQWIWQKGEHATVPRGKVNAQINRTREQGFGVDLSINPHSVRRYAAPIHCVAEKRFAVLALAQVCSPADARPAPQLGTVVAAAADQLSNPVLQQTNPPA